MAERFLRDPGKPPPKPSHPPDPSPTVIARRPMLGFPTDPTGDSDAFGEWLTHLAAGRIEVRQPPAKRSVTANIGTIRRRGTTSTESTSAESKRKFSSIFDLPAAAQQRVAGREQGDVE